MRVRTRTVGRPGFYSGGGSKCPHRMAPVPGSRMRRRDSHVSGAPSWNTDMNPSISRAGFMARGGSKCSHQTAPVPGGEMRRRDSCVFGISTGAQTYTIGRAGFMAQSESKCPHRTAPVPGSRMRRRGSCVFGISTGAQTQTIDSPGFAGWEQVLQPDGAGRGRGHFIAMLNFSSTFLHQWQAQASAHIARPAAGQRR